MHSSGNLFQQRLAAWRQGTATLDEIRKLAADLGKEEFEPGIPVLMELLHHGDEIVRYNAVISLGFDMHYRPATEQLFEILKNDPDEDCRDAAAGALRQVWANSRDRRVLAALAESALHDGDEDVRSAAYMALLVVNGVSNQEYLDMLTSTRPSVDAERVRALQAEITS